MPFDINEFRSVLDSRNAVLRTNKFKMEFTIPIGLQGGGTSSEDSTKTQRIQDTVRYMEYFAEAANQPGMNLLTYDGRKYTYGPLQKRPYVTGFNDLVVTFYDDTDVKNWQFFLDWLHLINHSVLSRDDAAIEEEQVNHFPGITRSYPYELNYREFYISDASMLVFDPTGGVRKKIVFRDLYPIAIADTPMNWSDLNSLLRLTVNFTFLDWYEVPLEITQVQYTK